VKAAWEIIAEKFNDLVDRYDKRAQFTRAERAIWFIIIIRCEIDAASFTSVFEQAVSRSEIVETIEYLKELDLDKIATAFEEVMTLLAAHGFYNANGHPVKGWDIDLPIEVRDKIKTIGNMVEDGQDLWEVDDKLLEMLNRENSLKQ
jgi:hypothetical protein